MSYFLFLWEMRRYPKLNKLMYHKCLIRDHDVIVTPGKYNPVIGQHCNSVTTVWLYYWNFGKRELLRTPNKCKSSNFIDTDMQHFLKMPTIYLISLIK